MGPEMRPCQIEQRVGEKGIVVPRGEGGTGQPEPGQPRSGIQDVRQINTRRTHTDPSHLKVERQDKENGQHDRLGDIVPAENAQFLQDRRRERRGRHTVDDAEADWRVHGRDGRGQENKGGHCPVPGRAFEIIAREPAHDSGNEQERPGNRSAPDIAEGWLKERQTDALEEVQVITQVEKHHRHDGKSSKGVEQPEPFLCVGH